MIEAAGPFDVGQAAVVANGHVIALEAIEGTDLMLERVAELRRNGRLRAPSGAGVLVKAPKPNQDLRFDLPAVGPPTVENVVRAGLAGIAIVAGGTVMAEPDRVAKLADEAGIFVFGIAPGNQNVMPAAGPLRICIVASEESGDQLGGALMSAVTTRAGSSVIFSGVGGDAMARRGLSSLFPIGELAIVGIDAVIAKLPLIFRRIRETAAAIIAARPDVLVIIDSPDFTHRVARKVRAALPDLPIVDYVSPTVWAWRPGRARKMRAYIDHVLALLPFEPKAHRELGGPPCTYVGHPLCDRLDELRPGADDALRREAKPPVMLVLPGSRTGEVSRLLTPFGETVRQTIAQCGPLDVVVPTVPHVADRVQAAVASWGMPVRVTVDPAEKALAFRTARAALAASGTVTLELAVAGIPTVVGYKVSPLEAVVAHLFIRGKSVVLANLVLGENVMPEFLQSRYTPESAAAALATLIDDTPARQRQLDAFARLDEIMGIGGAPASIQAADIVLALAKGEKPT